MDNLEQWINNHIVLCGGLMAFITSLIRVWRRPTTWVAKILDSSLCMSLTIGLYYGLSALHDVPETACLAIGSFVGYLGTEQVKTLILSRVKSTGAK